jgi:hypothetical protein
VTSARMEADANRGSYLRGPDEPRWSADLLREVLANQQRMLGEFAALRGLVETLIPRRRSHGLPLVDALLLVLATRERTRAFGAAEAFTRSEARLTPLGVRNAKSLGRRLKARVGISVGTLQLRKVGMGRGATIWCFVEVLSALKPANPP